MTNIQICPFYKPAARSVHSVPKKKKVKAPSRARKEKKSVDCTASNTNKTKFPTIKRDLLPTSTNRIAPFVLSTSEQHPTRSAEPVAHLQMPTYYAAGVSVRLSVTQTNDSLTHNVSGGMGPDVRAETNRVKSVIERGEHLKEGFPVEDDSYLKFLGNNCDVPFYCVDVVAPNVTGNQGTGGVIKKPARKQATLMPLTLPSSSQALSLLIELDKERSLCRTSPAGDKKDVKIEVFFNGQFTNTDYISKRGGRNEDEHTKLQFSGQRVDRVVEAAWLLHSPSTEANSALNPCEERSNNECEQRWKEIGAAIKQEADAAGRDEKGRRSPSAEYLDSLARLKIPEVVKNFSTCGGLKFGTIDVIITLGEGKKYSTADGYLRQPRRMLNTQFRDAQTDQQMAFMPRVSKNPLRGDKRSKQGPPRTSILSLATRPSPVTKANTPWSSSPTPNDRGIPKSSIVRNDKSKNWSSIGFLDAARTSNTDEVIDIENYGLGPPPPRNFVASTQLQTPKGRLETKPRADLGKLSEPADISRPSNPGALSPSPTVLSTFSRPFRLAEESRNQCPSKIGSGFLFGSSQDHPILINDNAEDEQQAREGNSLKSPQPRKINVNMEIDSTPRAPSYSPITPISTPRLLQGAAVEPSAAERDITRKGTATDPLNTSTVNHQLQVDQYPFLMSKVDQDQNILPSATEFAKQSHREGFQMQTRSKERSRFRDRTASYSAIQRLARQPLRKTNVAELGPKKIILFPQDPPSDHHHESLMSVPQNAEAASDSTVEKPRLIIKLKMPKTDAGASTPATRNKNTVHTSPSRPNVENKANPKTPSKSDPFSLSHHRTFAGESLNATIPAHIDSKSAKKTSEREFYRSRTPYAPPPFEIPELSRDCIISYASRAADPFQAEVHTSPARLNKIKTSQLPAQEDAGQVDGLGTEVNFDMGAYRQVRSERTGEFVESEVLLGVRFVVGSL